MSLPSLKFVYFSLGCRYWWCEDVLIYYKFVLWCLWPALGTNYIYQTKVVIQMVIPSRVQVETRSVSFVFMLSLLYHVCGWIPSYLVICEIEHALQKELLHYYTIIKQVIPFLNVLCVIWNILTSVTPF